MKIDLQVYDGTNLHNEYIYWHIRCYAEGVPSDEPRMKETMQMLWDRLVADKKGYARIAPRLETQHDFDSDGPVLRGVFRLTTTKEDGDLIVSISKDDAKAMGEKV